MPNKKNGYSLGHRVQMVAEGMKDVIRMSPEERKRRAEIVQLSKKDPVFRDIHKSLTEMKYSNRVVAKEINERYNKNKNKERGTPSSSQRKNAE